MAAVTIRTGREVGVLVSALAGLFLMGFEAIGLKTTEKFRRLHWLYWQIYNTRIDTEKYEEIFHRDLIKDFRLLLLVMKLPCWIKKEGSVFTFSERGTRWSHRFQMLFSLTFIDEVWTQCQREPWPKQIILY